MISILDTDSLVGMFYLDDTHHKKSTLLLEKLLTASTSIYLLPTVLSEFALIISAKIGMKKTHEAVSKIYASKQFIVLDITSEITDTAIRLYLQQTSKEESLFDCFVMAAAKKIRADCIFSFDKGYTKNGFILLEEYIKRKKMNPV